MNATAEASPESVEARAGATFRWVHDLSLGRATDARAAKPKRLADTVVLLYDGAVATAQMDNAPGAARTAHRAPHRRARPRQHSYPGNFKHPPNAPRKPLSTSDLARRTLTCRRVRLTCFYPVLRAERDR